MHSPALPIGTGITLAAGLLLAGWISRRPNQGVLLSQAVLLLLVPLVLLPIWEIGDQLRGAPIRELASIALKQRSNQEGLAMVGLRKPSLHFYSRSTVIFEGRSANALVNLADRLQHEARPGLNPMDHEQQPSVLLLIDRDTALQPHWQGWIGEELAQFEPYRLWRLDRRWMEERARQLGAAGKRPNWRELSPERF